MKFKIKILLITFLLLTGCGGEGGGGSSTPTSTSSKKYCVSVYTLGNVVNAAVTDSARQKAEYNSTLSKYCFSNPINYPISVKTIPDTYIDVDYNNTKTANDVLPKFTVLKSYYNYIDLVTNMHAVEVDKNITSTLSINASAKIDLKKIIENYENEIDDNYDINLTNPSIDEKILNFVAYDYFLNKGKLPTINNNLFDDFNKLKIFFDNDLSNPSIKNKVHYYSFFHSLELLDKHMLTRADTIHKPSITYLHKTNLPIMQVIKGYYYNVIAKDIKIDDNGIYTASGFDGVVKFTNTAPKLTLVNQIKYDNNFSNSYNLDMFSFYNKSNVKRKYLFVADGGESVDIIDITGGQFNKINNKIMWKYYDEVKDKNISITIDDTKPGNLKQVDDVISVKTYISPLENKMWLAFGAKNKGLYLVDLYKILDKFDNNISYPIIKYNSKNDVNNTLWITGDKGTVYSEAFSNDGENIYATKGKTIEKYDLSSYTLLSKPKPQTYNIKANNAYNLKMVTKNGIDELFVSTDKGVETYNVLNNEDLTFTNEYTTEGAQSGYLPKMAYISDKDILLFTDGYKGLKAIKYDTSYNPHLCGVGYFSYYADKTKAAKVTSVDTYFDTNDNNYYVVVGVDGYGLLKFKLDDLLFKHCK